MTLSRHSDDNDDDKKKNKKEITYVQSILTGAYVGTLSTLATYPLDKILLQFQNGAAKTYRSAAQLAFGKGNLFTGLKWGLGVAVSKNLLTFPIIKATNQCIDNSSLARFTAGILSSYITNFMNVLKTKSYYNLKLDNEIVSIKELSKGAHARAIRDGIFWAIFLGMDEQLKNNTQIPSSIRGIINSFTAAFFNQTFAIIASRQQLEQPGIANSMWHVAKQIYYQPYTDKVDNMGLIPEGLKRCKNFYPKFFSTSALRLTLWGGAASPAIALAEKNYNHFKELYDNRNETTRTRMRKGLSE